jgi:hypothetical protein
LLCPKRIQWTEASLSYLSSVHPARFAPRVEIPSSSIRGLHGAWDTPALRPRSQARHLPSSSSLPSILKARSRRASPPGVLWLRNNPYFAMAQEIISKKTRYEFREFLVGWTLREIEMEFDAADISCHPPEGLRLPTGARRSLVEQYYASLDLTKPADSKKLLAVYGNVLAKTEAQWPDIADRLAKWLSKDGFVFQNGRLEQKTGVLLIPHVKQIAAEFDANHMAEQIRRMESAVDSDPALAVGSAKELVETCCRTILSRRGIASDKDWDLPRLVKETAKTLKLTPDDIPESAKGAESIRRILGNLGAVSQGLAELRNLYGTGHGKEGKARGLSARHARLAAGCASSLTTFLFETHKERNSKP